MAIADMYYLDAEGLHAPEYQDVLDYFIDEYRALFGEDAYLEPDGKDYQFIAVFALALYDTMQTSVGVYNSFSPATGTGDSLTRNVAINGLHRLVPTYSTVDLALTGTNGTVITNGYAKDAQGRKWMLPVTTTIVTGGTVTVTATAEEIGAVDTAIGTVTVIGTPTRGWFSVTNAAAAVVGNPVETDAQLRIRQGISTMFPSQSPFDGVVAAVAAVSGVTKYKGYENDTDAPVGGVSANSIALVVSGGDEDDIAEAINMKKSIGCGTDGDVPVVVYDAEGYPKTINFYRPTEKDVHVTVAVTSLTGWVSTTSDAIKAALVAHINALAIGDDVLYGHLWTPANLYGEALSATYKVTAITFCLHGGSLVTTDIAIAFTELATAETAGITVTVT